MSSEVPSLDQTPAAPQGNQLRFVLDVMAKHWVMLSAFSVVASIVGGLIGNFMRVESFRFEASSDLEVRQSPWERPGLRGLTSEVFGRTTPKGLKERINRSAMIEDVVRAMIQEDVENGGPLASITSEEERRAQAHNVDRLLQLDDLNEAGILRVRVLSDDEDEARRVAESATRVVVEHAGQHRRVEQEDADLLVQEQLEDLRNRLDEAQREQWNYREEVGFQTRDQVWSSMEKKDEELAKAKAAHADIVGQLREIELSLEENEAKLPDSLGNVSKVTVTRLIEELEVLLGEKVELMVDWLPGSPGLAAIEEEIDGKEKAVEIAIEGLNAGEGGASGLWGQQQDLYRQRVDLELEQTLLTLRTDALEDDLTEMVSDLPSLKNQSFRYEQLSHEAEQIKIQFDLLLTKKFEIKTALNRGLASVERRNAVIVSPQFTGSRSSLWASFILGAFIGFVIGFALAMMWEMMDTSIQSIEDVNYYIGLEVIGMIPLMKFGRSRMRIRRKAAYVVATDEAQVDACIVTQHDPKSPISEAYRSFRTNFQFATIQSSPKTVMITSAVPGEGKTTTAVNFAVTMADRGMRALIVDTDLRRPNVHRVLKMERGPGLADVLRERIPVKDVIRETRVDNLWSISSGRVPPNPSELIGSERMKRLMVELGNSFDLVICDAPSVLVVTDPVLLATQVDTAVLVISVNNARRETIQRAKSLIETANPFISGVVLNGLEATRRHYYYYYYYYDDAKSSNRRRWYHNI